MFFNRIMPDNKEFSCRLLFSVCGAEEKAERKS